MDASHDKHESNGAFWPFANIILAVAFGGFALISSVSLLVSGLSPKEPAPVAAAPAVAAAPVPAGDATEIMIRPETTNPLAYDTKSFTVKSGKKVRVTFNNESALPQPHNMIICRPGTKDKVLALATAMLTDPQGMAKGYIPDSPDILSHTKLLQPKESQTQEFVAPAPGEYPYFCSFPGHAIIMNGVMKVE